MKTRNNCRDWRELLGAYALGHLQGAELVGLEAHLEGCAQCRAELALLKPVAQMLPHADPEHFESVPQPPADLGARIAATIAGERRQIERRRRRRVFGGLALGGATAALAAAVLAIFVLGGGSGEPQQHVRFASLPQGVAIDATLEPHTYGTEIRMYVHGIASGTLCTVSLKGPGGVSYPAGTFRYRWGEDSEAVLSSALDLSRTRAVVVHAGKRVFVAPLGRASVTANTRLEEEST
ncbi:MAG TPA: zf-HC2 domain-containing protein [Solirubrobacterales bacterium]|nr:zf-HC2 domain-containing protein [Solirubrobacterales bacterium]